MAHSHKAATLTGMKRLITSAAVFALALSGALLGGSSASAQAYYGTPSPNGCIYHTNGWWDTSSTPPVYHPSVSHAATLATAPNAC